MKYPILKGTIEIKGNILGLEVARDRGDTDAVIIHKVLDFILAQLPPELRERISFSDCEIKEVEGCELPF